MIEGRGGRGGEGIGELYAALHESLLGESCSGIPCVGCDDPTFWQWASAVQYCPALGRFEM